MFLVAKWNVYHRIIIITVNVISAFLQKAEGLRRAEDRLFRPL